jgi:hypothetical protein
MHPLVLLEFEARAFGVDPCFMGVDRQAAVFVGGQWLTGSDALPFSGDRMDSFQMLISIQQTSTFRTGHMAALMLHSLPASTYSIGQNGEKSVLLFGSDRTAM